MITSLYLASACKRNLGIIHITLEQALCLKSETAKDWFVIFNALFRVSQIDCKQSTLSERNLRTRAAPLRLFSQKSVRSFLTTILPLIIS